MLTDYIRDFWQWLSGLPDEYYENMLFGLTCVLPFLALTTRPQGKKGKSALPAAFLDQVLLWFSPTDPFRRRDLVRSACIIGAAGSGKTSGSGNTIAKKLVLDRSIGGLILASKPEELEEWKQRFKAAGRNPDDLLVFSPDQPWRFNILDNELKCGADARELTQCILTISETLQRGSGAGNSNHDPFWRSQNERMIQNAIEIVKMATGALDPAGLHQFMIGAAKTPQQTADPAWQAGPHLQMIKTAYTRCTTDVQRSDWQMAFDYWVKEYPSMADKTRSSVEAGVYGIMFVFCTGIVKQLLATTTNISPAVMEQGKWILVNMPVANWGAAGQFVNAAFKYATQRHILRRHAKPNSPITVIWVDEFQNHVNSFDSNYLCECRSHHGGMVVLTQSLHNFFAEMGGKSGEHFANALLTNFGHKIAHACGDDQTAGYFASLIGTAMRTDIGGSMSPNTTPYEEAMGGQSKFSGSFNSTMALQLEHCEFFKLKTGGPANGFQVEGIVIRSGEPFSSGKNWMRGSFNQK